MPRLNLDLGEPLASDFHAYCEATRREKTNLLRGLVDDFLRGEMDKAEIKKRVAEWRRAQSKSKQS